ncbi:hypothetical protein FRC02_005077 [Tulasnella sp. 418]|nr:hypothetical protein FRC02_005077 [Tulasnella sp. 418]
MGFFSARRTKLHNQTRVSLQTIPLTQRIFLALFDLASIHPSPNKSTEYSLNTTESVRSCANQNPIDSFLVSSCFSCSNFSSDTETTNLEPPSNIGTTIVLRKGVDGYQIRYPDIPSLLSLPSPTDSVTKLSRRFSPFLPLAEQITHRDIGYSAWVEGKYHDIHGTVSGRQAAMW